MRKLRSPMQTNQRRRTAETLPLIAENGSWAGLEPRGEAGCGTQIA